MGKILVARHEGVHVLKFVGDVRLSLGPTIATFLSQLRDARDFKAMIIDLAETEAIDSTALGLIAKIAICTRETFDCATSIISPRDDITRILRSMAMERVCVLTREPVSQDTGLCELPQEVVCEETLREQVIDAHRTLMKITDDNHTKFHDLVDALENEQADSRPGAARAG